MVGRLESGFHRGGIYLARFNPVKTNEVGKIRPAVVLTSQKFLDTTPEVVFVCPLSSQSYPNLLPIHPLITARENLKVNSYALVEHCRSLSVSRLVFPKLAQLTQEEVTFIVSTLQLIIA